MSAIFGETLTFGQEHGPEVRLVVHGDESYAVYETEEGYTVMYDDDLGLFCYTLVREGRFESSGIPLSQAPPAGILPHARESDEVRGAKAEAKRASRMPPRE